MKPLLPLSLAFWATASLSHAQLQPMVQATSTPSPPLTSMAISMEPAAGPLIPMGAVLLSPTTASPMLLAKPDADVQLTPLAREGAPEIMYGNRNPFLSNPVPALLPLAPPLQITPTGTKPVVLKKPAGSKLTVKAASSAPAVTVATPNGTSIVNQLTDAELSPNPNIPTVTRPEDQLLALDVTLNAIPRNIILEVYYDDHQTLWLPLTPLMQLLEVPVSINAAAGVAQGWYQTPSNTLLLTMANNRIIVGKQTFPTEGLVEKHETDLYITAGALKQWLDIDSKLDFNQLQLAFTTPHPLPGDLRARRIATWDKTSKSMQRPALPSDTIIPAYTDFSVPVIRLGFNGNLSKPADDSAAASTGLTLQAENDIMGLNSNIALSFTQQTDAKNGSSSGLSGGSLLMQKQSEKNDLLGPLHARYFGFGDITTNPIALSNNPSQGRGVRINNTPRGAVNNPDQYILTGPAPINWDVEVYQDQALVGFSRIDASGTYRFTALPLRAGRNVFRIVLYGPNGEREERRETTYLGDNIPAVGTVQYDTAVYQPNKSLIPGLTTAGNASNSTVTAQAQLTTGLSRNWAATVGAFQTAGDPAWTTAVEPPRQGVGAGLRGSMGSTYLTSDAFTTANGQSLQASVRAPLTDTLNLRLSQSRNFGYQKDDREDLTTTNAEIAYPFKIGNTGIDTTYGYTNTTYQTQPSSKSFTQRTSFGHGYLNATNELGYTVQGGQSQLNGNLETAIHMRGNNIRAGLGYQPDSPDPLRQLTLNTQLPIASNQTLNLLYTQQLAGNRNASLAGSLYWQTGPWAVGLNGLAGTDGNASIGLNLTTALVPQGYRQARWKLTQPDATIGQGQALVRVFTDTNANGRYDASEPVLPNVTVFNRQRGTEKTTNAQGMAQFTDLTPGALARMEVDLTTLPDIYLKPVSETLNVKPHTGDNGILNLALTLYGEVSGQALTPSGQPLQNLTLTLTNADGKKVDTTLSEHDGYYTFGALPMGAYTITAAGAQPLTLTLTPQARIQTLNVASTGR